MAYFTNYSCKIIGVPHSVPRSVYFLISNRFLSSGEVSTAAALLAGLTPIADNEESEGILEDDTSDVSEPSLVD